ncbi:hypothetical protein Mapa_000672 [Marchantia paleacea]|nr:hypothetical protein Mapa_000672 [Marchantia paleacea]
MEKKCELCGDRATLYCAADDADVCWSCDAKVHSANFLVARHARSVLCTRCCQETDCKTSGPHPSPLSRLCSRCNPSTTRAVVKNCNGDSEEMENSETLSYPSASTEAADSGCTCASQESHTGEHLSRQGRRKSAVEMVGRARGSRRFHGAEIKRFWGVERGKTIQGRKIQKRSSSPTGLVIQTLQLETRSHRADRDFVDGSGVGSNSVSPTNDPCHIPLSCELTDEASCVSYLEEEGSYNEDVF